MKHLELVEKKIKYWMLESTVNVEGENICKRELKKYNLIKTYLLYGANLKSIELQLESVEKELSIVNGRFFIDDEWLEEKIKEYKKEFNKTYDPVGLRRKIKTLKSVIKFMKESD